jgi:hypothetical protein
MTKFKNLCSYVDADTLSKILINFCLEAGYVWFLFR